MPRNPIACDSARHLHSANSYVCEQCCAQLVVPQNKFAAAMDETYYLAGQLWVCSVEEVRAFFAHLLVFLAEKLAGDQIIVELRAKPHLAYRDRPLAADEAVLDALIPPVQTQAAIKKQTDHTHAPGQHMCEKCCAQFVVPRNKIVAQLEEGLYVIGELCKQLSIGFGYMMAGVYFLLVNLAPGLMNSARKQLEEQYKLDLKLKRLALQEEREREQKDYEDRQADWLSRQQDQQAERQRAQADQKEFDDDLNKAIDFAQYQNSQIDSFGYTDNARLALDDHLTNERNHLLGKLGDPNRDLRSDALQIDRIEKELAAARREEVRRHNVRQQLTHKLDDLETKYRRLQSDISTCISRRDDDYKLERLYRDLDAVAGKLHNTEAELRQYL